jgi:hypothetical protein
MWDAPFSARQLAGRAQIRDVQLLRDVVRIGEQSVLVVVPVRAVVLLLVLGLARALGGLLLLELSALRTRDLGLI